MKRLSLIITVVFLLIGAISASAQTIVFNRYVIEYKNNLPNNFTAQVEAAGGSVVRTIPQIGVVVAVSGNPSFVSSMSSGNNVNGVSLAGYSALPAVQAEIVSPDATGPTVTDDLYNGGLLWGINRVNAPAAWAAGITGSHNTVVAVIDTGIAWNHPDLAPNVIHVDCYTSMGSFADGGCNPYPSLSDHGTHVAGTVAAAFGGGRVVGVGPNLALAGYNTFEVIPDCGVCSYSDSRWIAMIDAADRGFAAINMSLGGVLQIGGQGTNEINAYLQIERKVAKYVTDKGTVPVAAAGNDGLNLNGTLMNVPSDIPGIVSVGATGIQPAPRYPFTGAFDVIAFYSNYGSPLTVAAPGGDCGQIGFCDPATRPANWFEYLVLSTIVAPNATCAATFNCPVGYGWKGGTSMASPHVAAIAGLVTETNPNLSANQIANIIKRTAQNIGDRQSFGHGMVDAYAAATAK